MSSKNGLSIRNGRVSALIHPVCIRSTLQLHKFPFWMLARRVRYKSGGFYLCWLATSFLVMVLQSQKLFHFAKSFSILPKAFPFCQKLFHFAKSFSILPKAFPFCQKLFHFAKSFSILPKAFPFCQKLFHFAKSFSILPKAFPFCQKLFHFGWLNGLVSI